MKGIQMFIQKSTEEFRTNSMENNIQHGCKYCLDSWTIVLEMLF